MTDKTDRNGWQANLPPRWLNDADYRGLTANAWALHTWTLVWGVSQENDGNLTTRDLPFIASPMLSRAEAEEAAAELVEAGIWETTEGGYRVAEWSRSQATAAEMAEKRATWRAKKRGSRSSRPTERPGGTASFSSGERESVPARNGTFHVGQVGQEGQAMNDRTDPGLGEHLVDEQTGEVADWPTAPIPNGEWVSPDAPGSVLSRQEVA